MASPALGSAISNMRLGSALTRAERAAWLAASESEIAAAMREIDRAALARKRFSLAPPEDFVSSGPSATALRDDARLAAGAGTNIEVIGKSFRSRAERRAGDLYPSDDSANITGAIQDIEGLGDVRPSMQVNVAEATRHRTGLGAAAHLEGMREARRRGLDYASDQSLSEAGAASP